MPFLACGTRSRKASGSRRSWSFMVCCAGSKSGPLPLTGEERAPLRRPQRGSLVSAPFKARDYQFSNPVITYCNSNQNDQTAGQDERPPDEHSHGWKVTEDERRQNLRDHKERDDITSHQSPEFKIEPTL